LALWRRDRKRDTGLQNSCGRVKADLSDGPPSPRVSVSFRYSGRPFTASGHERSLGLWLVRSGQSPPGKGFHTYSTYARGINMLSELRRRLISDLRRCAGPSHCAILARVSRAGRKCAWLGTGPFGRRPVRSPSPFDVGAER
jgi:hypothetical protein